MDQQKKTNPKRDIRTISMKKLYQPTNTFTYVCVVHSVCTSDSQHEIYMLIDYYDLF